MLNPSKAIAMAICPIIVHFSTWRARSMHDVACEFARAAVRSKDAQKQLARTSLSSLLCRSLGIRSGLRENDQELQSIKEKRGYVLSLGTDYCSLLPLFKKSTIFFPHVQYINVQNVGYR